MPFIQKFGIISWFIDLRFLPILSEELLQFLHLLCGISFYFTTFRRAYTFPETHYNRLFYYSFDLFHHFFLKTPKNFVNDLGFLLMLSENLLHFPRRLCGIYFYFITFLGVYTFHEALNNQIFCYPFNLY